MSNNAENAGLSSRAVRLAGGKQQEDPCAGHQRRAILAACLGIPPHALAGRLHLQVQHRAGLALGCFDRAAASPYRPHLRAAATARAVLASAAAGPSPAPAAAGPYPSAAAAAAAREEDRAWVQLAQQGAQFDSANAGYTKAPRGSPEEAMHIKEMGAVRDEIKKTVEQLDAHEVAARLGKARPTSATEAKERQRRTLFGRLVSDVDPADSGAVWRLEWERRELLPARAALLLHCHVELGMSARRGGAVRTVDYDDDDDDHHGLVPNFGQKGRRHTALAVVLADALVRHWHVGASSPPLLCTDLYVLAVVISEAQSLAHEHDVLKQGLSGAMASLTTPATLLRVARCVGDATPTGAHLDVNFRTFLFEVVRQAYGGTLSHARTYLRALAERASARRGPGRGGEGAGGSGAEGGAGGLTAGELQKGYENVLPRHMKMLQEKYFQHEALERLARTLPSVLFPSPGGQGGMAGAASAAAAADAAAGAGPVMVRRPDSPNILSGLGGMRMFTEQRENDDSLVQDLHARLAIARALLVAVETEPEMEASCGIIELDVEGLDSILHAVICAAALATLRGNVAQVAAAYAAASREPCDQGRTQAAPGGGPLLLTLTSGADMRAALTPPPLPPRQRKGPGDKGGSTEQRVDGPCALVRFTAASLALMEELRQRAAGAQSILFAGQNRSAAVRAALRQALDGGRDAVITCDGRRELAAMVVAIGEMRAELQRCSPPRDLVVAVWLELGERVAKDTISSRVMGQLGRAVLRDITQDRGAAGDEGSRAERPGAADRAEDEAEAGGGSVGQVEEGSLRGRKLRPDWQARQSLAFNRALCRIADVWTDLIGWRLGDHRAWGEQQQQKKRKDEQKKERGGLRHLSKMGRGGLTSGSDDREGALLRSLINDFADDKYGAGAGFGAGGWRSGFGSGGCGSAAADPDDTIRSELSDDDCGDGDEGTDAMLTKFGVTFSSDDVVRLTRLLVLECAPGQPTAPLSVGR